MRALLQFHSPRPSKESSYLTESSKLWIPWICQDKSFANLKFKRQLSLIEPFLFLWSASCCDAYTYTSQIYIRRSQLIILIFLYCFLKTTVRNNLFVLDFIVHFFTTCFGPNRWPSSGNMYIKYILRWLLCMSTDPLCSWLNRQSKIKK
jgi:hypothetical protein